MDDFEELRLLPDGSLTADEVAELLDEIDRLNQEVSAHQVSAGYDKGWEHGALTAARYKAERDHWRTEAQHWETHCELFRSLYMEARNA